MRYVDEFETHQLRWGTLQRLLRRYRWLILTVFLVTALTGLGVLQIFFTDLYETECAILVKIGRENTEVPMTVVKGTVLSQGVRIEDINSEVQILSDRNLVEEAVDKIGAERYRNILPQPTSIWGYPKFWLKTAARFVKAQYKEVLYALNLKKRLSFHDEVVLAVSDALKVEPIKQSDVLTLKLRLPSPQLAVDTANEILAGYLRARAAIHRNADARKYYTDKANSYLTKLDALQNERAAVRDKWGLSSATEQRTLLLKQLTDLDSERIQYEGQVKKLVQERDDMKARMAALPRTLTKEETYQRNPGLQSIKERITNLKMERAKLLGRYQPDSEVVLQVDGEIQALQNSLKSESATILASTVSEANPLREEFRKGIEEREVSIAGLRSELAKLAEPIKTLHQKLDELNVGADALERVEREYQITQQSYLAFHQRMSEAGVSQDLDEQNDANVAIMSAPSMPLEPVYPRKLFIMGILLPVGLLLGIGIAALLETMNDRVRDESDLATIPDLPYLGVIGGRLEKAGEGRA